MRKQINDLLERLEEAAWSHDCWGRSERYDPPAIQIEAALTIECLLKELELKEAQIDALMGIVPKEPDNNFDPQI